MEPSILFTAAVKFAAVSDPEPLVSKAEKMFEASPEVPPLALTKLDNSSCETLPSSLPSNRLRRSLPMLLEDEDEDEEDESLEGGEPP